MDVSQWSNLYHYWLVGLTSSWLRCEFQQDPLHRQDAKSSSRKEEILLWQHTCQRPFSFSSLLCPPPDCLFLFHVSHIYSFIWSCCTTTFSLAKLFWLSWKHSYLSFPGTCLLLFHQYLILGTFHASGTCKIPTFPEPRSFHRSSVSKHVRLPSKHCQNHLSESIPMWLCSAKYFDNLICTWMGKMAQTRFCIMQIFFHKWWPFVLSFHLNNLLFKFKGPHGFEIQSVSYYMENGQYGCLVQAWSGFLPVCVPLVTFVS